MSKEIKYYKPLWHYLLCIQSYEATYSLWDPNQLFLVVHTARAWLLHYAQSSSYYATLLCSAGLIIISLKCSVKSYCWSSVLLGQQCG